MAIRKPAMVLIDVDGTLVDSVPDLAYCVDAMMGQLGREPWGEARVRDWVGNGVERLVKRALIGRLEGEPDERGFERAYADLSRTLCREHVQTLGALSRCDARVWTISRLPAMRWAA